MEASALDWFYLEFILQQLAVAGMKQQQVELNMQQQLLDMEPQSMHQPGMRLQKVMVPAG
ncbi:hypothetical protein GCM10011325_43810 [Dyadobacter sediminis]|nr:hypothetical protein GCM10011325_43810 [Dyadobacter sediminis]